MVKFAKLELPVDRKKPESPRSELPPGLLRRNKYSESISRKPKVAEPKEVEVERGEVEEKPLELLQLETPAPPDLIGLDSLPLQRERMCKARPTRFTMVLAGCSGTGKTTFLNTLFSCNLEGMGVTRVAGGIRETLYELEEDGVCLQLTVIELPGFGTKMDNHFSWLPIVDYIQAGFWRYLVQEEQPDRLLMKDHRVNVCLYFLLPSSTQLSALDLESMKEISKRVSLIPIVAKSDTLNKDELASFKLVVNNALAEEHIQVCKFVAEPLREKILATSPYAVVGANTTIVKHGCEYRARKYDWGVIEIDSRDDCDFVQLRRLLMSEHLLELIEATEEQYQEYRRLTIKERLVAVGGESADGLDAFVRYKPHTPSLEAVWGPRKGAFAEKEAELHARMKKDLFEAMEKLKKTKIEILSQQTKMNAWIEKTEARRDKLGAQVLKLMKKVKETPRQDDELWGMELKDRLIAKGDFSNPERVTLPKVLDQAPLVEP